LPGLGKKGDCEFVGKFAKLGAPTGQRDGEGLFAVGGQGSKEYPSMGYFFENAKFHILQNN